MNTKTKDMMLLRSIIRKFTSKLLKSKYNNYFQKNTVEIFSIINQKTYKRNKICCNMYILTMKT